MNDGSDLVFKIRTEGDLKAFESAKKALQEQRKSYEELGKSTATIDRQIKQLDATLESSAAKSAKAAKGISEAIAQIRSAGGKVDSLVAERNAILKQGGLKEPGLLVEAFHAVKEGSGMGRLEGVASLFGKGALAAAGGIATALEIASESVKEYSKSEGDLTARNAALKQRGQFTAEYTKELDELAETLQSTTAIDNDRFTRSLTTGIQAGVTPAQMQRFADMVKNAAGLPQIFGNVEQAAEMVGKAVGGSFEQFQRMGIVVRENATLAEKLDDLYKQLATRGGDQLEQRAKTLRGRFDTLKNSVADLFKTVGKGIADTGAVQGVLGIFTNTFDYWTQKLRGTPADIKKVSEGVKEMGGEMLTAEQRALRLQETLTKIQKIPEDAAKRREQLGAKLSKESAAKTDSATDAAGLEIAKINQLEQFGLLKPEEAEARRRKVANGLEETKQGVAVGELNSQIANRQQGLEASKTQARKAEDTARLEEQKLERAKRLASEEEKLARHYDNKIAPLEAQIAANIQISGAGMPGSHINRVDPKVEAEIAEQKRQKDEALKTFREKNPYNIADQEERARAARATADATAQAELLNARKIAEEKAALEQQLNQTVLKNRIQNQTRGIGDFGAVYGAIQKGEGGNGVESVGANLKEAVAVLARNGQNVDQIVKMMQEFGRFLIAEQQRGQDHSREIPKLRSMIMEMQSQMRFVVRQ